jgi:hypothetical protein
MSRQVMLWKIFKTFRLIDAESSSVVESLRQRPAGHRQFHRAYSECPQ